VGKSPNYPLDNKSGGAQNRFELSYKIKVLVYVGIRFLYCPHVDTSLTVPLILNGKLNILFKNEMYCRPHYIYIYIVLLSLLSSSSSSS